MVVTKLTDELVDIHSIFWDDDVGSSYSINPDAVDPPCTKIIPYEERGIHDFIPYLAVYKGDKIVCRVPAYKVSIFYK